MGGSIKYTGCRWVEGFIVEGWLGGYNREMSCDGAHYDTNNVVTEGLKMVIYTF